MAIYKINKNKIKESKNLLKSEYERFKSNKTTFENSYICANGEPSLQSMRYELKELYNEINKSYVSIDRWLNNYIDGYDKKENRLKNLAEGIYTFIGKTTTGIAQGATVLGNFLEKTSEYIEKENKKYESGKANIYSTMPSNIATEYDKKHNKTNVVDPTKESTIKESKEYKEFVKKYSLEDLYKWSNVTISSNDTNKNWLVAAEYYEKNYGQLVNTEYNLEGYGNINVYDLLECLTEEEKNIYNYLYFKKGKKYADKYILPKVKEGMKEEEGLVDKVLEKTGIKYVIDNPTGFATHMGKSVVATATTASLAVVDGINTGMQKAGEAVIWTKDILETSVNGYKQIYHYATDDYKKYEKDIEDINKKHEANKEITSIIKNEQNIVDNLYDSGKLDGIEEYSSISRDGVVYNVVKGVGEVGFTIALAGGGSSTVALATSGGVLGAGSSYAQALETGATASEAQLSGGIGGLISGIQWGAGAAMNSAVLTDNPILNSAIRVGFDAGDGALGTVFDSLTQMIYADGYYDENGEYIEFTDKDSILKRFSEIYKDNGGLKASAQGAILGGGLSFLNELSDGIRHTGDYADNAYINKQITKANKLAEAGKTSTIKISTIDDISLEELCKLTNPEKIKFKLNDGTELLFQNILDNKLGLKNANISDLTGINILKNRLNTIKSNLDSNISINKQYDNLNLEIEGANYHLREIDELKLKTENSIKLEVARDYYNRTGQSPTKGYIESTYEKIIKLSDFTGIGDNSKIKIESDINNLKKMSADEVFYNDQKKLYTSKLNQIDEAMGIQKDINKIMLNNQYDNDIGKIVQQISDLGYNADEISTLLNINSKEQIVDILSNTDNEIIKFQLDDLLIYKTMNLDVNTINNLGYMYNTDRDKYIKLLHALWLSDNEIDYLLKMGEIDVNTMNQYVRRKIFDFQLVNSNYNKNYDGITFISNSNDGLQDLIDYYDNIKSYCCLSIFSN